MNRYYELDATVPHTHIYAGDLKVATVEDGTDVIYHHPDHLTGTNVDTDETGAVLEVLDYYPYGNVRLDDKTGTYENAYKYTGKELDEETNLYYYGARYYNAAIGRFVSQDPLILDEAKKSGQSLQAALSNPQLLNGYSYVANNPMKAIDPTGEILFIVTTQPPLSSTSDYNNYKKPSANIDISYPVNENGIPMNSLDEQLNNSSISVRPVIEAGIIAGTSLGLLQDVSKGWSSIQNESQNQFQNVKPGSAGGPGTGKNFAESVKKTAREQSGNQCVFCGKSTTRQPGSNQSQIDHAIPKYNKGNNSIENAQNTCRTCNLKKGIMNSLDFLNKTINK